MSNPSYKTSKRKAQNKYDKIVSFFENPKTKAIKYIFGAISIFVGFFAFTIPFVFKSFKAYKDIKNIPKLIETNNKIKKNLEKLEENFKKNTQNYNIDIKNLENKLKILECQKDAIIENLPKKVLKETNFCKNK